MSGAITVEPASDGEALQAWLAVRNAVWPTWPVTADEVRHSRARHAQRAWLLARLDGEAAGAGFASVNLASPGSEHAWGAAWVLEPLRRRGVGRALAAAVGEAARGWGCPRLETLVRETDPDALAFVQRRGFVEEARQMAVALDLTRLEPGPVEPPEGVAITTLGARPDLEHAVWEVEVEGAADLPGPEAAVAPPFEQWRERVLGTPSFRPDALFVALAGNEVVGYALLEISPLRPTVGFHAMTAVLRAWRGRGVASALKRAQIAWAVDAGFELLETENEQANAPMRHINAQLGYAPQPAWIVLRGPAGA
jgi:GNAT superfamily N-acetyltransferase